MERATKVVLLAVTLLLMASMGGGFLLLPLLVPGYVWAARRSGGAGKVAWSLLPAASVGMVTWAAVYVALGESQPAIWLLPLLAVAGALVVVLRVASGPHGRSATPLDATGRDLGRPPPTTAGTGA